jgi:branched-chain amino acid aminotransferase
MPTIEGLTPLALGGPTTAGRGEGVFRLGEIGLPFLDHGLLYGDAVFEGILAIKGRLFLWRQHWERLQRSASRLAIDLPYSGVELSERVSQTVRAIEDWSTTRLYVRLIVSRGLGDLGINPGQCLGPSVYAIVAPLQLYPSEVYEHGIALAMARSIRRPGADTLDPSVKSCNYLNNILALLETRDAGRPETLMLGRDGFVAEATADNIFLIEHEPRIRVLTPATDRCLNGITRRLVMRFARSRGYEVRESRSMLPTDWIGPNREAFLTGTAAGIVPVTTIDTFVVGDGRVGAITLSLRDDLRSAEMNPTFGLAVDATTREIETYLGDIADVHP